MAIELPPGHKRPKIKFKRVAKPKPPPKTPEERAAEHLAKTEKRYGITPNVVNAVIMAEHGLLTNAAAKLNMTRHSLVNYIDKNPVCLEALEQARAVMGDVAELSDEPHHDPAEGVVGRLVTATADALTRLGPLEQCVLNAAITARKVSV